jgi:hypothetical protein
MFLFQWLISMPIFKTFNLFIAKIFYLDFHNIKNQEDQKIKHVFKKPGIFNSVYRLIIKCN